MIDGMKFHVKGDELKDLLAKRSLWHKEKSVALQVNLKQAKDGMDAAANAAAAAGQPSSPNRGLEVMSMSMTATRRPHGGNMEDPVAAIQEAITFHTIRAAALNFYSNHLVVETTYVLGESDVARYELIEGTDWQG